MTQSNLLQLAQSGNADAIAALMNNSLRAIGVSARVTFKDGNLYVLLESERILAQSPSIEFIRRGIRRLGIGWLSSAIVYGRVLGQQAPHWVQQIDLTVPALVNPFTLEATATIGVADYGRIRRIPHRQKGKLLHLLLLSVPLLMLLGSGLIWSTYLSGSSINGTTGSAQTKQPPAEPFVAAMEQVETAVKLGKVANSRPEWRQAVNHWQQAIATLQTVPKDHSKIAIAQARIADYQTQRDTLIRDRLGVLPLELVKTIQGAISPKSVDYSGKDLFFAQNMMYSHSITVYDRNYNLVKTISDQVKLADYGYPQYPGTQQGAPVEATFSHTGESAWISNYQMYGAGFGSAADDDCSPASGNDPSFLYRIDTNSLNIANVVQVGSVPKHLAATPNHRYVLASNWCSWDVSIVDTQQNKEIRRIQLGPYPRGVAIAPNSETAYVAVMGSHDIATINLNDFSVGWLHGVGHSPRHLNIDPAGRYLYATLNGEGQVAKIDLASQTVVSKVATGGAPRSMTISADGQFLYVVNYNSDTVSKIRTQDMQVMHTISVNPAPIGITYDPKTHQVWVACYSGSILVLQD